MKYSAKRSVTWGFLLAVICMSVFVWITYSNMQDTLREGKSVSIALRSLRILESIQEDMQQMETAERGYVITGNRQDLAPYFYAARQIRDDSITLHSLITDDQSRKEKLQQLLILVRRKIAFTDKLISVRDSAGYGAASQIIITGIGKRIMDSIHNIIYEKETADRVVLRNSNTQRLKKAEYTTTLFFTLSGIFFLGFIIAYFIIQRNLLHQQHHQAELLYLSTLVKQTSETIFSTDPAFIIRSWNKAAEKMYHYTSQEAVGKSMHSLFTVCLDEVQKNTMLSTLLLNGFYNGKFNVIHRNGQTIFVEASITVLQDANGKIDGYVAVHKDVTDRKKLEDELRRLNERLEENVAVKTAELTHIFERITDAFVALDNDWCYTYVNQRAGEIIHMAPSDLIGKNIWEIFPDGKNQQLIERCRQAVAEQQYYYVEEYYPNVGKWFENHLYPSPKGLSIFFRDITDEKMAEQALHESGEKYKSLIELATDAILINQDGLIQYVNPAALNLFGLSGNEEMNGKKCSDLFHPDYHQSIEECVAELMASGNSNFLLEEKVIRADGNTIDVEVVANLFTFKGGPAIEMVIRNLSERKETEKKLRASDKIFNHSVDLLCIVGSDGYFKVVNPAWTKILGWNIDELLAKPWVEFVHPDDRGRSQNPVSGVEKQESISHIENRYLCKDGTWKWISWNTFAYPMEQEIFGVGRDVTAGKKVEDELLVLNEHLQERAKELALSNSELERFAYVASHDLQEPLRMVSSFMDLLKRNYQAHLDNRANQYIDFAVDGSVRMKQLIMDLLEYSRVGTNNDEFINTDVNKVVQEVVGIFVKQGQAEMPEITYPVLPVVMANKSQMAQLFQNLVGNAIKYKSVQKAMVHISYTEDESYFTFIVNDNGIGIDPLHYERIFILFQRLHLKDEYSGTGIGLTICKKIVEKHGGTIWVESKPGEGSTFYFTIKKQL